MQKYLELEKRGRVIPITLQVSSYPHGNLAIQLLGWEAGYPEPWSSLTVNLDGRREKTVHSLILTIMVTIFCPGCTDMGLLYQQEYCQEAAIVSTRNSDFGRAH